MVVAGAAVVVVVAMEALEAMEAAVVKRDVGVASREAGGSSEEERDGLHPGSERDESVVRHEIGPSRGLLYFHSVWCVTR